MSEKYLFPVFDVPSFVTETEKAKEKNTKTYRFDVKTGDFVRDGANRVTKCNAMEGFIQWCIKVISTQRYAHLAYPDFIGCEMEEALSQPTNNAVCSMLERTICEALLVNPLTEYVRDFSFAWNGDQVRCNFTVKGRNWEESRLSVSTNIGGDT